MYEELHRALLGITRFFNRPQADNILLQRANVSLDTALFPLVVYISLYGPVSITQLAEEANRDYSTISRQVAKLEARGLVMSSPLAADQRVRQVMLTPAGRQVNAQLAEARFQMMDEILQDWDAEAKATLTNLVSQLAHSLESYTKEQSNEHHKRG